MKICVVFNPTAGGERAARFRGRLAQWTKDCVLRPTDGPGAARAIATRAVEEGFKTIVAAGGDGTVNEVLNGIGDAPDGFARTSLGVLPLGTVNVFAKEIRMPSRLDSIWRVILLGQTRRIDLPWVQFRNGDERVCRHFAQMAGAGWDSMAIDRVSWSLKKRIGPLAYVLAGLRALRDEMPMMSISNGSETVRGQLILIGNGAFYGGRYALFPHADLADGLLEVSVFPRLDLPGVMRGGLGILLNRLYTTGQVIHMRGAELMLTSSVDATFHVEGENAGRLPARFGIRPQTLQVIVP